MLALAQAILAFAIAAATIHYARSTRMMVAVMREQAEGEHRRERIGIANVLAGSAIESVGHAASLAEVQRFGLKTWRRWVPESDARREFAFASWRLLTVSVISSSKAFEQVRYVHPDFEDIADHLYDLVLEVQLHAMRGEVNQLQPKAVAIREAADELRHAATDKG